MNDHEYLANAGIDAETGGAAEAPDTAASTSEAPAQGSSPAQPTQAEIEMFSLGEHKFPVNTEFQFPHGGKVLKVPYSTLTNTYRQQQHLQEKWNNEYKPKIDEFQKLRPDFDRYKGFYDKYGALQEWSEKNPQEWERLAEVWKNKDQHLLAAKAGQMSPEAQPHLEPLIQELSQVKQANQELLKFRDEMKAEREQQQVQKDTETVKKEIHEFQDSYKEINLQERDPDGVSLWAKVIRWGVDNGYQDFKAAARVYLDERIQDVIRARERADILKTTKQDKQNGIIKRSPVPLQNGQVGAAPKNIRAMSYSELAELAKSELASAQN